MRGGWAVWWSGLCSVVALGVSPAAAQAPEAVLLLDGEVARGGAERVVEVVKAQMMRIHRVVPGTDAVDLARREPQCGSEGGPDRVVAQTRAGSDLFFGQTDLDGATRALEEAMAAFFESPCIARGDEAVLREVCAGAVLLVRLYLLRGQTRQARDLARRVAVVFPPGMVEGTHEPPEVLELVSSLRTEGQEASVTVGPKGRAEGTRLLVNGIPVGGGSPWQVRMAPGVPHELAVLTASGSAYVWRGLVGAQGVHLDLDVADQVLSGPMETLRLAEGVDPAEEGLSVARRIAEVSRRTVLLVRAGRDGAVRVEEVPGGRGPARELMRLRPLSGQDSGIEVVVEPGGPLLSRPAWPWPYIAAGAALGLLGAGVYLNVAANRDADAVNQGLDNRAHDYWVHRNAAIACYALAGASGAAAVVLSFLRPEPRNRFIVLGSPMEGGGFVSLGGAF